MYLMIVFQFHGHARDFQKPVMLSHLVFGSL